MSDNTLVKCPHCGKVSWLDECEVCGADEGNVFCPSPLPELHRPASYYIPPDIENAQSKPGCGAEFAVVPAVIDKSTESAELGQMELFT